MFKRLLAVTDIPKEVLGDVCIYWTTQQLEIYNYAQVIKLDKQEIIFKALKINGSELKIIYQDPVLVRITGKINQIIKGEEK